MITGMVEKMCSHGICKGYEEGICNYFGIEIPYNTIQLIGKPKDKEHVIRLKQKMADIARGMQEGEKRLRRQNNETNKNSLWRR